MTQRTEDSLHTPSEVHAALKATYGAEPHGTKHEAPERKEALCKKPLHKEPLHKEPLRKEPLRKKVHLKVLGTVGYSTQQQSRLLSLPRELRTLIWEYVLTAKNGYIPYMVNEHRFDLSDLCGPSRIGLFATCHMVALETKHLSLTLNVTVFVGGANRLAKVLAFFTFIRKLREKERLLGASIKAKEPIFAED